MDRQDASQDWLQREQAMQDAFFHQAERVPDRVEDEDKRRIGLEIEYIMVDKDGPVAAHEHVERNDRVHVELGENQVELTTPPFEAGLGSLEDAVRLVETRLDEQTEGVKTVREPVNPWVSVDDVTTTPIKEKYERVPAWADNHQSLHLPTTYSGVDYEEPRSVGLFQGLHVNAQAQSLDHAVTMLNNAYSYAPLTALISGRPQRSKEGRIKEHDVRPLAWEAAFDHRTLSQVRSGVPSRFGIPSTYLEDWSDYTAMISEQPFILNDEDYEEHALNIAMGMDWRDARLKIQDNKPVVEVRTPPVQRSPRHDALVGITLAASLQGDAEPPPTQYVGRQRETVLRLGHLGNARGHDDQAYVESFKDTVRRGLGFYDVRESAVIPWLNSRLAQYGL